VLHFIIEPTVHKTYPHIHFVTEAHPRLSVVTLKDLWLEVSPRTSHNAIDIRPVSNLNGLARYFLKEVRWGIVDTEPIFFGPKSESQNKRGFHV